ncbi:MAG: PEP-utilizing enzyme [Raineya sp.]|jgi:pyruvate,water dikinase|nr:PEP-utilizing enzyme [Raineya sp.]
MILFPNQTKKYKIGGKAKNLCRLKNMGLPIPDFVVIPNEAFEDETFTLHKNDKDTLLQILKNWDLPNKKVIVRSSVHDEDGFKHSFAGLMESFLDIDSFDKTLQAITICAQSAFSEKVMAYRKQKNIHHPILPAVIVQKQVSAISSGVVFTTNPQYPQEMAIHATKGLGVDLVQGNIEPDEFYLWKKDGLINRQKNIEEYILLSDKQLKQIWTMSNQIEISFGYPQDIEFVFDNEHLYIVQTRPITQEIPKVVIYDNSNIQESYCGVTTPLTFSFAQRAYATVYRQTMKSLGLSQKVITQNEPIIQNLLGLVKGRIYYNINNWYQGLKLLPSFKQNKKDMERMMGVEKPIDFVEDHQKTFLEKLQILPSLLFNLAKLLWAFRRLPISIKSFLENFRFFYQNFYEQDFSKYSWNELQDMKKQIDVSLLENWSVPIINDFYVMMSNGKAIRHLKKLGFNAPEEFLSRFFAKKGDIVSTQPFIELQKLAKEAKENPELTDLIFHAHNQTHENIQQAFPNFFKKISFFIEKFGDRTIGELKLETHTMRTHFIVFYKYLVNLIKIPEQESQNQLSLNILAQQELDSRLIGKSVFFKNKTFNILNSLQKAVENRELLRLERTRLFGMYRTLYRTMGLYLQKNNYLNDAEDIFYLYEKEIEKFDSYNLKSIIEHRKKEFEGYLHEKIDSQVIIPFPPSESTTENQVFDDKILIGSCCVAGEAEGEVIVISNPTDTLDVVGKIICALRTDPGWAALFPACKAVLIEKGSALSHSAILLRELGIPTIINIPKITDILKSGQHIRINAEEGKIYI